jgi:hypothetical protein
MAESLRGEGMELARAGDVVAAADAFFEARNLRATADALEAKLRGTSARGTKPKVSAAEPAKAKVGRDITPSRLRMAAAAKGYSLRQLAAAVGESHAVLSDAHAGQRAIKRSVADAIARLIDFPATSENWPYGFRS